MPEMTNTQLAELFLLRLYDIAEAEGHGKLVSLNDIAAEFGVTDVMKIHNVAKLLEGRGFIQGRHAMTGGVRAKITGEGAVFVESGGETGVIREYRTHPESYRISIDQSTHFHGDIYGSNLAVHSAQVTQESSSSSGSEFLLSEIAAGIRADTTLSEQLRKESLSDVAALRAELQKQRPRRGIIDVVISHLGDVASVTSLVMQLQQYLPQIPGLGG